MLRCLKHTMQLSTRGISLLSRSNKKFEIKDNREFIEKVMNSTVPVIVNFHAEWCDPCKILTPKLEQLVGPMEDLNLAVVDVESNPELVHTFEVKAVPAVIAVSNGLVVHKFIGLMEADSIENLIQKLKTGAEIAPPNKSN
ncbi:thioredoxin, mitochondrial [Neodiprion pinetum]|uniref:thioredoxin, mitochondrial n=1 Tax=Neodiprion pinetum TaxID=441929 RepID=UPI001EDF9381|nr:thioredoxin, mitochondrial [Neodiprion pinetum]XP_046486238.1 thioredoxin, mitochondrial [Neodiprion pinetum]XP_046486239.1 thioredoxin, mitochondrial [Neodiprion pinetum]XP_046486241.1 thioredoxin, mitochondrial [Neodiprion pinetum]XP_046625885.1 thioredoxin, mitochondrial [Neodiprion virginianus]XP_046625886.1 thioredoxin, mitochondrial [Neodiprion virginianus]XP_046625887.1 thioredoxin, mitochondrial [Neodiprion virginianus]XP_046625888.1 thioredoxin, mitochondrial [Neodiprion virginia